MLSLADKFVSSKKSAIRFLLEGRPGSESARVFPLTNKREERTMKFLVIARPRPVQQGLTSAMMEASQGDR